MSAFFIVPGAYVSPILATHALTMSGLSSESATSPSSGEMMLSSRRPYSLKVDGSILGRLPSI